MPRALTPSMNGKVSGPQQVLLGFDARELFLPPSFWDAERRASYLLRDDVQKPLSVDVLVWPSLFGDGLPEQECARLGLDVWSFTEWRGPNQHLWADLTLMREALGELSSQPHWLVAVSWVSTEGFARQTSGLGPYHEPTAPPTVSEDWVLLGFDVADSGHISGLTNCGYRPAEVGGLRAAWAPSLNEHHLFADVDQAFAFKALADRRVAEHAPFFVYGLWRIEGRPRTA